MPDSLRILLSANLNVGTSIRDINQSIKAIESHPSLQKIKIKLDIDDKFTQSINKFIAAVGKMTKIADDQNKVIREEIQELKNLDGSIERVTTQYLKNGDVIEKTRKSQDARKKSIKQETDAINEQKKSLEDFISENEQYNKTLKDSTLLNAQNEKIKSSSTFGEVGTGNKLTVNTDKEGNVTNARETIDHVKNEKIIQDEINRTAKLIHDKDAAWSQALDEYFQRESKDNNAREKALQEEQKIRKAINAQAIKDEEERYNQFISDKKKEFDEQQRLAKIDKQSNSLGTNIGKVSSFNMGTQDLSDYVKELAGADAEFVKSKMVTDDFHGSIQQVHYRVKEGGKYWHNYTASLVEATGNTHILDKGLSDVANRQLSLAEKFKVMGASIPLWFVGMGAFMQSVHFFTEGIKYVNDFNATLTQIGTAVNYSQDKLASLGKQFQALGQEISASTADVAAGALEYYRQGLGDDEVLKRLKTTTEYAKISGLDFQQSAELLTAASNSMNVDVNKVADTFALLGDATATSASEIGIAFQKVGGTANSLQIPFDKVASYIATISAQTRESAETVGSSVKAIFSRIGSVKEKGYDAEDGTTINQVSKALSAADVQLVNSQGQFRNFATVLDELGAKWATIDDKTKRYIATTVAGSYQQSRFLTLMDNYGKSLDLNAQATNSAGAVQSKYNIYLESTQAHLDRLRSAMQGLWSNSFNSKDINNIIDSLTSLVKITGELVDKVGLLPVIFGSIATATALMNKNFRTMTLSVLSLGKGIESLSISADVAKVAIRGLLASTLVGAAFAALGFVVEKVINLFADASNKQQEYFDKLNANIQQSDDNANKLADLNEQYKTSQGTQEELLAIREQMAGIMPEIIDHYDAEGKAVYRTAEQIDGLIDKYKQLNLEAKRNSVDSMADQLKTVADSISASKKTIQNSNSDLNYSNARNQALTFADQFINQNDLMNLDKNSKAYIDKMNYLQNEIKKIFSKNHTSASDTFLVSELLQFNGDLGQAVEDSRSKLGELRGTVQNESNNVSDGVKQFAGQFKSYNDVIVQESGITDKNVQLFLNNFADGFLKTKDINSKNYADIINQYKGFADSISKYIIDNKIDVSKAIDSGKFDVLNAVLAANGVSAKDAAEAMKLFSTGVDSASNSASDFGDSVSNVIQREDELSKSISDTVAGYKDLASSYETLNKGESLSLDTLLHLIDTYPQIASYIAETNDLTLNKGELIKQVADAERKAQLQTTQGLIDEVENTRNALDAKRQMYEQFYNSMSGFLSSEIVNTVKGGMFSDADQSALDNANKQLDTLNAKKKLLEKPITYDFKVSGGLSKPDTTSKSKGKSKGAGASSSAPKDQPTHKDDIDAFIASKNKQAEATKKANDEAQKVIDNYTSEKKYSEAIKATNTLLKGQQKEIGDLVSANKELGDKRDSLQKANSKYDMSKWIDQNGEATKAYLDLYNGQKSKSAQDALDILFGRYQKLTMAMRSNTSEMTANKEAMVKTKKTIPELKQEEDDAKLANTNAYLDKRNKIVDDYNAKIGESQKRQQLYEVGTAGYNHELQIQNDLRKKSISFYENEIASIKEKLKLGNLTKDQIAALTAKMKEYDSAIIDVEVDQKQAAKDAYDAWLSKAGETADKAVDEIKKVYEDAKQAALDNIDAQITAEDKRHQNVVDNYDEEMNKFEDSVNQIKKAMDRQDSTDNYNADLKKKQDDAAKTQNLINQYSLDNSIEGQAKKKDLEEQLATQLEDIQKMQNDRTKELRNNSLDDMLSNEKQQVDAKKKAEDDKYNANKERLDKQKADEEKYWDALINDDAKFLKIRTDIINGNVADINKDFATMKSEISSHMDTIGTSIQSNLIDKLSTAHNLINSINHTSSDSNPFGMSASDFNTYLSNKKTFETSPDSKAKVKAATDNAALRKKYGIAADSYTYAQLSDLAHLDTGGITPSWGSGGKLAMLHENEMVANKFQTKDLLKVMDWTQNLLSKIKLPDFSNITGKVATAGATNINLTMNIDTVTGDQKGADFLFNQIQKGMKKYYGRP